MGNDVSQPVPRLIEAAGRGDRKAAGELLPTVYQELRRLAAARLAKLPPGQTLQPTALVHEAYMQLVGSCDPGWDGRAHFFAAAAQAMRQILVDRARRRLSQKRGGGRRRVDLTDGALRYEPPADEVLGLHEAIERLQQQDPRKAEIVMLRYFAGLTREQTANAMNLSVRTVDREWKVLVALLHKELEDKTSAGRARRGGESE